MLPHIEHKALCDRHLLVIAGATAAPGKLWSTFCNSGKVPAGVS